MKKFETVKRINVLKNGNIEIVLKDHKDGSQSSIVLIFTTNRFNYPEINGWTEVFTPANLKNNKEYIDYEVEHE